MSALPVLHMFASSYLVCSSSFQKPPRSLLVYPLDIDKSEFEVQEVRYLGLNISTKGVAMDPLKVATIQLWEGPEVGLVPCLPTRF